MIQCKQKRKRDFALSVISWASSEMQKTTYNSRDALVVTQLLNCIHAHVDYFYALIYAKVQKVK